MEVEFVEQGADHDILHLKNTLHDKQIFKGVISAYKSAVYNGGQTIKIFKILLNIYWICWKVDHNRTKYKNSLNH